LGLSLARKLTALGAQVITLARNEERGQRVAKELGCDFIPCDISDPQWCRRAHEAIVKKYGDIDILINNAGIRIDKDHGEDDPSKREQVFGTNILGAIDLIELFVPAMRMRNSGMIANVVSTTALPMLKPSAYYKTYAASKSALARYSDALRADLKDTKIKVIQFFPGGFESNNLESGGWPKEKSHNLPGQMKTDDVADCLMFMLTRPDDIEIISLVVEKK